ncbi:hypothetical protein ASD02_01050 [Ensifer sp. Root1252]|nr:hypothetical protein ASD00_16355 [Ensifer sp. Root31]KQW62748.1 hypothetical protein ASD02_01050 [Ensifer sp. Root1252]KQW84813.1 hypothetical protein ASD03_03525 [Ensifer sp. Root127]KQY71468.1 hypothetical protein ASD52_07315 [Ensifer sp. Root142]KRC83568.1 hypothetical protein ASE32_01045 [Ensifer sp. Root231]KRC86528.1 hypothetical protein ASE47_16610 [Ensifer sp. Root258]OMQ44654.1 hypothetical protein BKP54_12065 [Ensifer sp. 1H6]
MKKRQHKTYFKEPVLGANVLLQRRELSASAMLPRSKSSAAGPDLSPYSAARLIRRAKVAVAL